MTQRKHMLKKISDEVSQASGFRCAWCGAYLTVRHHIIPYAKCLEHKSDNLILLCDNCHRRAHKGEISQKKLAKRRLNLSGKVDRASGHLCIGPAKHSLTIGNCEFVRCDHIIVYNNTPILSVKRENDYLLISMQLFNEAGNLICWMSNNFWWVENEAIFDFSHTKKRFSVREKIDHQLIDVEITDSGTIVKANLYIGKGKMFLSPDELRYYSDVSSSKGSSIKNFIIKNWFSAIRVTDGRERLFGNAAVTMQAYN